MTDEEQKACKFVEQLHGEAFTFSRDERVPVADVPDFRIRVRGVALWAEIKTKADKLSPGQLAFLKAEYHAGQIVFAGDADALLAMLMQRPNDWRAIGYTRLAEVVGRGLRKAA